MNKNTRLRIEKYFDRKGSYKSDILFMRQKLYLIRKGTNMKVEVLVSTIPKRYIYN